MDSGAAELDTEDYGEAVAAHHAYLNHDFPCDMPSPKTSRTRKKNCSLTTWLNRGRFTPDFDEVLKSFYLPTSPLTVMLSGTVLLHELDGDTYLILGGNYGVNVLLAKGENLRQMLRVLGTVLRAAICNTNGEPINTVARGLAQLRYSSPREKPTLCSRRITVFRCALVQHQRCAMAHMTLMSHMIAHNAVLCAMARDDCDACHGAT